MRGVVSVMAFIGFWMPFLLPTYFMLIGEFGVVIWSITCFIAMCAVAGGEYEEN